MKKRKHSPGRVQPEEVIVAPEILEGAKRASLADKLPRAGRCSVCGSDCSPSAFEQLCWVCRRLKISAWRDSDLQMGAPE
jgi:hypothetical protein